MKVVGTFNKVSEKLRKELIPVLKPNEIARFQLLNGSFEPALGREGFGAARSIRLQDRILDPYAKESKDEKGGIIYEAEYVDIGVPETIRENRVERCKKHWVESIAIGIPGNGQFALSQASIDEMEVMEFLCLSNGNKSNPYRDKSREPIYEKVDAAAILAKEREKDFKEIKARLSRLAKDDPEKAAELGKLIPKQKEETTPV